MPRSLPSLCFVFLTVHFILVSVLLPSTAYAELHRDRQHRQWRRRAAEKAPSVETATTTLPAYEDYATSLAGGLLKRATTTSHTGVWTSTAATTTIIITTASSTNRCGAAKGTRTVCQPNYTCSSLISGTSSCRATTSSKTTTSTSKASTSSKTTSYVTTGTGVWTSTGPTQTAVITTAKTTSRCGSASGTRTVCQASFACSSIISGTSSCRLATSTTTKATTTSISTSITTVTSKATTSMTTSKISTITSSITTTSSASTSTSTSTSTGCAATYTGAATTIRGTGTLPKATTFVTRTNNQLMLSGKVYRPVGPNIYWLGIDENVGPYQYPSKQRVREAMAIAVAMGANTIRAHTLGISVGLNISIEPSLGTFNDAAFDIIDYALYTAREYGLRVIIPLTDEHDYYHGGRYTFLRWLGTDQSNYGSQFYTNQTVITAFQAYISHILTRYNTYSQTYYYNDPTILAWETGNELGGYIGRTGYPPLSWTDQIAAFIKTVAANTLIMDGTNGIWNYTTGQLAPGLNSSNVDIMSDHFYPLNNGILNQEKGYVEQYKKAYIAGEYDWTGLYGGSSNLTDFISAVTATNYMGDLPWSVFGHDDQCCQYVPHNDGYSIYYPNGNSVSQQARILQIAKHWYSLTGRTVPSSLPAVACPQPAI